MGVFEMLDAVEDRAITAANPQGINAYDKGASFEEATGGVERDYHGRFAPESGSNRSERRQRRSNSIFRRKKERKDAEDKKSRTATDKAKRERERAKEEAEREQLAQISLAIAEAVAAGDTIKAAELRVQRAERALAFADTNVERINAQTTLTNARAALARARRAATKRTSISTRTSTRTETKSPYEEFYDLHGRYPNEDEL